ncbi:hypothetical protein ABH917_001237 [Thermobifida halotolerans]
MSGRMLPQPSATAPETGPQDQGSKDPRTNADPVRSVSALKFRTPLTPRGTPRHSAAPRSAAPMPQHRKHPPRRMTGTPTPPGFRSSPQRPLPHCRGVFPVLSSASSAPVRTGRGTARPCSPTPEAGAECLAFPGSARRTRPTAETGPRTPVGASASSAHMAVSYAFSASVRSGWSGPSHPPSGTPLPPAWCGRGGARLGLRSPPPRGKRAAGPGASAAPCSGHARRELHGCPSAFCRMRPVSFGSSSDSPPPRPRRAVKAVFCSPRWS